MGSQAVSDSSITKAVKSAVIFLPKCIKLILQAVLFDNITVSSLRKDEKTLINRASVLIDPHKFAKVYK